VSDLERLRTWLSRAAPQRYELVKALFMAALASLAGTGLFVGAMALLVVSVQRPALGAIAVFLIAIELVAFLRSPLRFAERMSTHRLGFSAVAHWRQWLMRTVGRWSYSRWQRFGAGDLLERSLGDTEELQDLWLRGVVPSVAALATMLSSDLVVGILAPRGSWWGVAVFTAALQLLMVTVIVRRLSPLARVDRRLRVSRGTYVATLVSSRAAAPEIERLGQSQFLRQRSDLVVATLLENEDALRREYRRDAPIVALGPILALGAVALAHPRSAPVWLVVASLVAVTTMEALITVRAAVHIGVGVIGGAERLDELNSLEPPTSEPWPDDHTLVFRDVTVATSRSDVRRVSGTVTPGRRVGITGPSGSGKSTLLRALARLDGAPGATILVDGHRIEEIAEDQLRAHMTLVVSEPGLVHGYVRDVVGMGIEFTDNELSSLARLGLDVQANDNWDELSRGERQRVALVRALARRPDILLLDEPTSALGEAETTAVLELLSRVSASVIVATHDERVLAWCDDVIDVTRED
jgi:ABC-type transport system involved in cytochrome bd biosynthesis fused ATPase/permease subunit